MINVDVEKVTSYLKGIFSATQFILTPVLLPLGSNVQNQSLNFFGLGTVLDSTTFTPNSSLLFQLKANRGLNKPAELTHDPEIQHLQ